MDKKLYFSESLCCPEAAGNKKNLDLCYERYNKRRYLNSDPVQILYRFDDPQERELAGLIAASIAYGRVRSILGSAEALLENLQWRPHRFLMNSSQTELRAACAGFRHRFTGPEKIFRLLSGTRALLENYGTIADFVALSHGSGDLTYERAISALAKEVAGSPEGISHLLPSPVKGSACKRLCLFFRWMIRSDNIDPGGWRCLKPDALIVPLDVHMMRICRRLGLTGRKNADWKAALEVTGKFRAICPEDPVKYDFALTRASMFGHPV